MKSAVPLVDNSQNCIEDLRPAGPAEQIALRHVVSCRLPLSCCLYRVHSKAHQILCMYATPHMLIDVPCSIFIASVLHALATPVEDSAASCNRSRMLCQHDQSHGPRYLAVSAAVLDTQAATLDGAGDDKKDSILLAAWASHSLSSTSRASVRPLQLSLTCFRFPIRYCTLHCSAAHHSRQATDLKLQTAVECCHHKCIRVMHGA